MDLFVTQTVHTDTGFKVQGGVNGLGLLGSKLLSTWNTWTVYHAFLGLSDFPYFFIKLLVLKQLLRRYINSLNKLNLKKKRMLLENSIPSELIIVSFSEFR